MWEIAPSEDRARFEVVPVGSVDEDASRMPRPVRLTVTCSPVQGPDRAVELAARLRETGHAVTVHVAARMVRDRRHLDALLAGMIDAGVDDVFLIGGDVEQPLGAYGSAVELLPLIDGHPQRPRAIGIAGYPEGHPLIADRALDGALAEKSRLADYVTTQLCFHPQAVRDSVNRQRGLGLTLPILIGMPGKVDRRKLLTMSARIGVGPSIKFLRKQHGLWSLVTRRSTADRLYDALAPMLDDRELGVAGFQYYTFNQLIEPWQWHRMKLDASGKPELRRPARAGLVQREETSA
jgi:methylenetetrahydrofolate reductase (NADPH)